MVLVVIMVVVTMMVMVGSVVLVVIMVAVTMMVMLASGVIMVVTVTVTVIVMLAIVVLIVMIIMPLSPARTDVLETAKLGRIGGKQHLPGRYVTGVGIFSVVWVGMFSHTIPYQPKREL